MFAIFCLFLISKTVVVFSVDGLRCVFFYLFNLIATVFKEVSLFYLSQEVVQIYVSQLKLSAGKDEIFLNIVE